MSELKTQDGQDFFDILLSSGYSLDQAVSFIKQNPNYDLSTDFSSLPSTTLSYDNSLVQTSIPSEVVSTQSTTNSTTGTVTGYDGQSLLDLILLSYGNLDYSIKFLKDNSNLDSINDSQLSQKEFTYDNTLIQDSLLFNSNSINNVVYNTGINVVVNISTSYILTEDSFILDTETGDKLTLE